MKRLAAALFILTTHHGIAADKRPNIVIILADDLGQRDLGCYGSTFHRTPHIDAMAARGMKFTNAYSASPLCSPTRASILTGLAPARIGITAPVCHMPNVMLEKRLAAGGANGRVLNADSITRLKTDYLTLPEALRDSGWRTGHLGKWHLGSEPYSPLQHGFESDLPHTPGPGPGGRNGYFAPWQFWPGEGRPGDHIEDRMAEEAEKFIAANRDRPFFLNYWAFSVHSPWMAKEDFVADAATRSDKSARQRNAMYAGMLRSLDDAVGRITAALEKNGVADNTIIFFTGDNGGYYLPPRQTRHAAWADVPVTSNAPFRSGKASTYEGGTRVPLIVVWPRKVNAGATSDAIVQSTDFFPTLLDLTGLSLPQQRSFDGGSFAPALRGEKLARETIFCHFPHGSERAQIDGMKPGTWVRRGDWKLIRFFAARDDGTDLLELYNLRDDPGEKQNLAAAKPELAAELAALITRYLADTEAVIPKLAPDTATPATKAPDKASDPLLGWRARQCDATVKEGIVHITAAGKDPFLGFAPGRIAAGSRLRFRLKCDGGSGKVEWLPAPDAQDIPKPSPFSLKAGEFAEVAVPIPAPGDKPGIIRLHLPPPAELDWIELEQPGAKPRRWEF